MRTKKRSLGHGPEVHAAHFVDAAKRAAKQYRSAEHYVRTKECRNALMRYAAGSFHEGEAHSHESDSRGSAAALDADGKLRKSVAAAEVRARNGILNSCLIKD